jgi:hypothetical protein
MDRFVLTKWYLDSVDPTGRSAILYSTALSWGRVRVAWHGVSICEPDARVAHRATVKSMPLPERDGNRLAWRADTLGCTVDCTANVLPFAHRLLDRVDGVLDWRCEAPAARVDVTLTDAPPLSGVGYAECLSLTCLPWRLPIDEMRWGRWVSDDGTRSLVWIDWKGPHPRTDAFLNGRPEPSPLVGDRDVQAGDIRLTLATRRPLYSRSLGSTLAGLGPVLKLLPASWRALEDAKWICRARLDGPGGRTDDGWCIDEMVRFPR